jgi:hypothetical protein
MEKRKNCWIIPTDQPSRLHHYAFGCWSLSKEPLNWRTASHIYITSDEEIKDGDWYYTNRFNVGIAKNEGDSKIERTTNSYKKIVLTTNPTLIDDGVQSISDEFLEWFVKNSSCEFVEVVKQEVILGYYDAKGLKKIYDDSYKIIIPQEGDKQEGYICPHTKIQCDDECCVSAKDCHITSSLASGIVEPKQETLEEAAYRLSAEKFEPKHTVFMLGVIEGAKWKAERMYTYDELRQIAYNAYCKGQLDNNPTEGKFNLWIQEFKKK